MKINTSFVVVITILVLSFLLRVVQLGSNPSILNRDEAALAYNALLLEKNGTDEWGERWPLTLQSFGDYKLIGYPALLVVFFKIFGYSDFVVRLPAALAGVGVLYCLYLLTKRFTDSEKCSVYTLGIAALTPVFFFYSRVAFEATVGLLLFLSFLVLIIRKVDARTKFYDLAALVCIVLAVMTYNTPLLLLPFIILVLPFLRGIKNVKNWILPVVGGVLIFAYFFSTFAQLTAQKQAITIFSDPTSYHNYIEYRSKFTGVSLKLLGNKYVYYFLEMIPRFFKSFSLEFLAIRGGEHPWHALPGWGHLLPPQYFVAMATLVFLLIRFLLRIHRLSLEAIKVTLQLTTNFFKPLLDSQTGKIVVLLYLSTISLLPSIITIDAPHATRSLFFMCLLFVISGWGLSQLQFEKKAVKILLFIISSSSIVLFGNYLRDYFQDYPTQQQALLQTGYQAALQEVEGKYPDQKVAVIDGGGYQYILTAWYLKLPPAEFYKTIKMQNPDRIGFRYGEQVSSYHFVKEAADRSQDEQVVVEWSSESTAWQIRQDQ